ncbi:hypothetical protein ACLOJK_032814 [Asimina triloba]
MALLKELWLLQPYHRQAMPGTVAVVPHPPAIRPRVRARRGQATDPHSIAERRTSCYAVERCGACIGKHVNENNSVDGVYANGISKLRRERIAERMKALQELVPSSNKTDRAAMLDEIVDYVKFLRLQVKDKMRILQIVSPEELFFHIKELMVLSMSRLGGAGAVAQLVAETPLASIEGGASEGGSNQRAWEKWSTDGTEREVAKLMEEDVGAAMQFLQSKALCIMPISLAAAIYHTHQSDTPTTLHQSLGGATEKEMMGRNGIMPFSSKSPIDQKVKINFPFDGRLKGQAATGVILWRIWRRCAGKDGIPTGVVV